MDVQQAFAKALPGLAISAAPTDRIAYARDLWPRQHIAVRDGRIAQNRPALVAWPESVEDVAAVVRLCASEGVPLVPFGAGSGVCGAVLPDARSVVIDLKRMQRWRRLDADEPSLEVEAGALGITLEERLADRGFTAGHFPSSILCSTVGGWLAARGAGQCSGLYGKIEDMVASIECVVGRGEVVRFERRLHGPDAIPLLIGSEGIFGVITSAKLRLHRAPETRTFGAFSFKTVESGWDAMRRMFQAGLRPAVARLYDPFDSMIARMGAVRRARKEKDQEKANGESPSSTPPPISSPKAPPGASATVLRGVLRVPGFLNRLVDLAGSRALGGSTLVLVFEGPAERCELELARADTIATSLGARPLGEEPARHWLAHRYSISYRQSAVYTSGAFSDTMEVAAPWSRLEALYKNVREALGRHVFVMAHLSHAYPDGCSIYFTFAGSAKDAATAEATYDAAWRDAIDAAIAAGGTLSHHHGVGRSKAARLGAEIGLGVELVRALGRTFDPAGIFNPGNLVPPEDPPRRPASPAPTSPVLDRLSMLVRAAGTTRLCDVERALGRDGLSLALGPEADTSATIDAWIGAGSPGAPDRWVDPVDHLVAGFAARTPSGAELEVRPSPRRAVGPDLFALFHGTGGRAGAILWADLRAHGPTNATPMPTSLPRDPAPSGVESAWIGRVVDSVGRV